MPAANASPRHLRAAVTVTQMSAMVGLSRAAFYDHVHKGHFLTPVYSLQARRPIYTADMQQANLEVKATQKGVNGEFVLFYERQDRRSAGRSTRPSRSSGNVSGDLRQRLQGLGLLNLTDSQVQQAVAACFPQGTRDHEDSHILRTVFRHLRRSGVA